jgi:adenosylcobinamide-GDP ribazoletransferase
MGWYPVIGLLLGALLVLGDLFFSILVARPVADLLLIVLLVTVTGALHQDGLADTLDGLAGGHTPVDRLAIMRDPRIGAVGATGLMLALGLRYGGLMALPQPARLPVLLCLPVVGRWAMVIGAWGAPYARAEGGLAAPFLQELSRREVLCASAVVAAALSWGLGAVGALVACGVAALAARAITAAACRLCGGVTGDTLGATNEVAEICFLLVAPALLVFR